MRRNERSSSFDAVNHRFVVGDLVTTTKRCWFGPGIRGEVGTITRESTVTGASDAVTIVTDMVDGGLVTVRNHHTLVVERRTGIAVKLRRLWRKATERMNR